MSVTISGSGQIIKQVVSSTFTSAFSSSSTSFTPIGLSATITPTNAANKIFIIVSIYGSSTNSFLAQLYRGVTAIDAGTAGNNQFTLGQVVPTNTYSLSSTTNYLDSPATTSAITYSISMRTDAGTFYVNYRGSGSDFGGTCTMTLMEIAYA